MIYYFISGKDYKEILSQYVGLTGKPIMPPKWALGFAQCRGLLTSEKLSREIAEGYRTRGIPCDIIYQDIGWTEHLQDFEWRKGNYGHPKKMLADLKEMGFKEEALGHNAIAAGFQGQRQWTDFYPNGDYPEALLNTSFDWNGIREAFVVATENDACNGVAMLFGHLLTNRLNARNCMPI